MPLLIDLARPGQARLYYVLDISVIGSTRRGQRQKSPTQNRHPKAEERSRKIGRGRLTHKERLQVLVDEQSKTLARLCGNTVLVRHNGELQGVSATTTALSLENELGNRCFNERAGVTGIVCHDF